MTIGAGKRREAIAFLRGIESRSSLGVVREGMPAVVGTRFANVRFGSSAERREAAADSAVQAATFRTLRDALTATITAEHKIRWDGLDWDITGIALVRPAVGAAELEFTATARRG